MARTKTNTQNDTNTRTIPCRSVNASSKCLNYRIYKTEHQLESFNLDMLSICMYLLTLDYAIITCQ